MKKNLLLALLVMIFMSSSHAQDLTTTTDKKWNFGADLNMFFYKDVFIGSPVFRADKNKLHLAARYNYEDLETFSGWIGYNFTGGGGFEYFITPMIGVVVGRTNGIAPGLEVTLSYKGFELYNESEYIFNLNTYDNNFFYTWTDLSYSPKDWLSFGLSGQLTQIYQTDPEFQPGVFVSGSFRNLEMTTYYYSPGSDPFLLVTLSITF
jgi:opacity protein-like surface antigen